MLTCESQNYPQSHPYGEKFSDIFFFRGKLRTTVGLLNLSNLSLGSYTVLSHRKVVVHKTVES